MGGQTDANGEFLISGPKQNRGIGYTLRIIAIIAALAVAIVGGILIEQFDITNRAGFVYFAIIAGVGIFFWNWGSRHLAPLGEEVLSSDKRPPIVYLRSFANETQASDAERAFAKMFEKVGPFVAIGAPGEKLPPLGAARLYLEDRNWKQVITDLVARAQLVIIYGGITPGLGWEVNHVKNKMNPARTVIMVSNQQKEYEEFRDLARSKAGLSLPKFPPQRDRKYAIAGTAGFVTFDRNWTPSFVKLPKAARRGRGVFLDDNIEGARTWAALSTISNNAGIRVGKPPRNWVLIYFDVVRIYLLIILALLAVMVGLYFAGILVIENNQRLYFDWPENLTEIFSDKQK